jgi:PGF-pre-PGF domain-containing protein
MGYFNKILILLLFLLVLGINLVYATSPDWANFDFAGIPYANQRDGKMDRWPGSPCYNQYSGDCADNSTYDLKSTWVDQDKDFIAWKITGNNLTGAQGCGGSDYLKLQVEFDSDGNQSTGCLEGEPCYPGSDYRIEAFLNDSSVFLAQAMYYNGTRNGSCPSGQCFVVNLSITDVYLNATKCNNTPSQIWIAINKSQIKWSTLVYSITSFNDSTLPPMDLIGANKEDIGGDFMDYEGDFDFMFSGSGCPQFDGNETACTNRTLNGNLSCIWFSDMQLCDPDFSDTTTYGCNLFCGACTTQNDCNSNPICKWVNSANFCMEDPEKFKFGGNCDSSCYDCFNQNSCVASSAVGGCQWVTDPVTNDQFCADASFKVKTCGPQTPDTSCYVCKTQNDCVTNGQGQCNWDSSENYCYDNRTGKEVCFNGKDDNNNNLVDCDDPLCDSDSFCGSDLDNKILTDQGFLNMLKQTGICTETNGVLSCDKEQILMMNLMKDQKPGPPLFLKQDTIGDTSQVWIDIKSINYKGGSTDSLGFGIGLVGGQQSAICPSQTGSGVYYYYLDTDSNVSTGCWENVSNTNLTGIDYKFVYNISYNGSDGIESIKSYRCINSTSNLLSLYPAMIKAPRNPFNTSEGPLCMFGDSMLFVGLKFIGNPSGTITFHAATTDNITNIGIANDTLFNATYTPGTMDFTPPNCEKNPFACGTAFAKIGGGKFMPFEDCFPTTGDEDMDGNTNCEDTDCMQAPWCASNKSALIASDKTAPLITVSVTETFDRFAFFHQSTNEPTNITLLFYNTSSSCLPNSNILNLSDSSGKFSYDSHKPWHDIPFDPNVLGNNALVPGTTYYYRTKNCDLADNCAISACLNFTTKSSGVSTFKFAITLDAGNDPILQNMTLEYNNGSDIIKLNFSQMYELKYATNTTLKFKVEKANLSGINKPFSMEFRGVEFAKTSNYNLTGAIKVLNDSNGKLYIGMNSTIWQNLGQNLGVDKIRLNISERGSKLRKCDENGSNCRDFASDATRIDVGPTFTVWEFGTYGEGGFSTYTSETVVYNITFLNISSNNVTVDVNVNASYLINITNNDNESLNRVYNLTTTTTPSAGVTSYINGSSLFQINFTLSNVTTINLTVMAGSGGVYNTYIIATLHNDSAVVLNSSDDINITTIVNIDSTPPTTAPTLTSVADYDNDGNIEINWTDDSNEVNPTYRIYRYSSNITSINSSVTNITTGVANGVQYWEDNQTTHGVNYWYALVTVDSSGNYNDSVLSSSLNATANDTIIPKSPTNLNVTQSGNTATIQWKNIIQDINGNADFYNLRYIVYTATSINTSKNPINVSDFTKIANVTTNSTTYTITATERRYFIVVTADDAGNENLSLNTASGGNFVNISLTYTAPSTDSGSSGGGSGGTGGGTTTTTKKGVSTSKVWSVMSKGANVMKIRKVEIGITELIINVKNSVNNVEITVTKLDKKPASITGSIRGTVYKYIEITKKQLKTADINNAEIKFKVEKSWLTNNNADEDDVVLNRYTTKWEELTTTKTGSDSDYVYYKAITPSFSYFAIVVKKKECIEDWVCGDYGECQPDGTQTRICTDSNDCGTTKNKPEESQTCIYTPPPQQEEKKEETKTIVEKGKKPWFIFLIIGIIIIIGLIAYFVYMGTRERR